MLFPPLACAVDGRETRTYRLPVSGAKLFARVRNRDLYGRGTRTYRLPVSGAKLLAPDDSLRVALFRSALYYGPNLTLVSRDFVRRLYRI